LLSSEKAQNFTDQACCSKEDLQTGYFKPRHITV
jgi:hypothetical protein